MGCIGSKTHGSVATQTPRDTMYSLKPERRRERGDISYLYYRKSIECSNHVIHQYDIFPSPITRMMFRQKGIRLRAFNDTDGATQETHQKGQL